MEYAERQLSVISFSSKKSWLSSLIWFMIIIILGWIFSELLSFSFIQSNYNSYLNLINQKQIFSSTMFWMLATSPLFAIYYYKKCIIEVNLNKKEARKIYVASFVGVVSGIFINSPFISFQRSYTFSQLFKILINSMDWLGAFIVCFFGYYLALFMIIILLKYVFNR
jgi:Na+/H+-translocating membrane pyrophosphatase